MPLLGHGVPNSSDGSIADPFTPLKKLKNALPTSARPVYPLYKFYIRVILILYRNGMV